VPRRVVGTKGGRGERAERGWAGVVATGRTTVLVDPVVTRHPVRFWPLFAAIYLAAMPFAIGFGLWSRGTALPGSSVLAGLGVGAGLALVGAFLLRHFQAVVLTPHQVRAFNCMQWPAVAAWEGVRRVDPRAVLGVPFLRVERDRGLPLWIPTFLARPEAFRDAVLAARPEPHPLAVAVVRRWGPAAHRSDPPGSGGGEGAPR